MKKYLYFSFQLVASVAAAIMGGGAEMLLAASAPLDETITDDAGSVTEDLGSTDSGDGNLDTDGDGIATLTGGKDAMAEEEVQFYEDALEDGIKKIRPSKAIVDQITRYANSKEVNSPIIRYYSEGTRPVRTTIAEAVTGKTGEASVSLKFANMSMFTKDDTFIVLGKKAVTLYKNADNYVEYETLETQGKIKDTQIPYLMLHVEEDLTNGGIPCHALNGNVIEGVGPFGIPDLSVGDKVLRLGKAGGELDRQTGRFTNHPKSDIQYCQNYMIQIEESEFHKKSAKKVNVTFSDIEEDALYDYRRTKEFSSFLGSMSYTKHPSKKGMGVYTTKGLWYMPAKDIYVGKYEAESDLVVLDEDDLVDISQVLFTGDDAGDGNKIFLCGSNFTATLGKIRSKKFTFLGEHEQWGLKFKKWSTDFGTILTIHCEILDEMGLSDSAFAFDPEFLGRRDFIPLKRYVLDLKTAGVRNTDAVVYQEVSGLILRFPKAHARVHLNDKAALKAAYEASKA